MNAADVVALAGDLPGTVVNEHLHWSALTVDEKGFCWISHPDEVAMVRSTSSAWLIVELLCVDDGEFAELLTEGWRLNARAADVTAYDTARGSSVRSERASWRADRLGSEGVTRPAR